MKHSIITVLIFTLLSNIAVSNTNPTPQTDIQILVNQVSYNQKGTKQAVVKSAQPLPNDLTFQLLNNETSSPVYTGKASASKTVESWGKEFYSPLIFTDFAGNGKYKIRLIVKETRYGWNCNFRNSQIINLKLIGSVRFACHI